MPALTRTRARAALTFSLLDELPEELIALSVAEALVRSDRPEGAVRLSRCSRRLRRLLSDACREAQNRSVIWTLSGLHLSQPIELKESERVKFDDDSRVATIKVRIRGDPYNWHELHGALVSHVALPPPHTPVGAIVMSWTVSVDFPTDKESHPGFYRIGCFDDSDHSRWWCFNGFSGRLDSQNGFGPNLVNGLEDSRPNVQEDAHTTIELILSASAAHGLQANRLWYAQGQTQDCASAFDAAFCLAECWVEWPLAGSGSTVASRTPRMGSTLVTRGGCGRWRAESSRGSG
eukprot:5402812-Prymnesium_polylepis.2